MQNLLLCGMNRTEVEEMISEAIEKALKTFSSGITLDKSESIDILLTKKQAAAYLQVSVPTLTLYINKGFIKAYSVAGTRMRFKQSELDKALKLLRSNFFK